VERPEREREREREREGERERERQQLQGLYIPRERERERESVCVCVSTDLKAAQARVQRRASKRFTDRYSRSMAMGSLKSRNTKIECTRYAISVSGTMASGGSYEGVRERARGRACDASDLCAAVDGEHEGQRHQIQHHKHVLSERDVCAAVGAKVEARVDVDKASRITAQ
jgi:hypothetical protein